jgi:hypothetical protein
MRSNYERALLSRYRSRVKAARVTDLAFVVASAIFPIEHDLSEPRRGKARSGLVAGISAWPAC